MAPPFANSTTAFTRCAEATLGEPAQKAPVSNSAVRVTCISAGDAPLMSAINTGIPTPPSFTQHASQSLYASFGHEQANNLRVRSRNADAVASQLHFKQYLAQVQQHAAASEQQRQQALFQPILQCTPGDAHRGAGVRFSSSALVPVMIRIARHLEERMFDEHDPRHGVQVASIFDEPAQLQPQPLARPPARWLDIVHWMNRIIDPLKLTPEITVYALILLERYFAASNTPFQGSNWRGIVLTAIIMAQKMQLDNSYHNFQVCLLCAPFNKYQLRAMELEFLGQISFDAYVSIELYNSWAELMLRTDAPLPRPMRSKVSSAKRQRLTPLGEVANNGGVVGAESPPPQSPPRTYVQKRKMSLHTRTRSNPQAMLLSMSSAPRAGVPPQQPGANVPRHHVRSTSTLPHAYAAAGDNDAAAFESLSVHHMPTFSRPVISIDAAGTSLCSSLVSSPQSIASMPFSPTSVSGLASTSNRLRPSASMYQLPTPSHVHLKPVPASPMYTSHEAVTHFNFQQRQHHAALLAAAPAAAYAQYAAAAATAATTSGHTQSCYSQALPMAYHIATPRGAVSPSSAAATAQYMRAIAAQQMAQLSALPSY